MNMEQTNKVLEESIPEATPNTSVKNESQPRYKSWAMWLSIFGALGVILNAVGVFEKIGINNEAWDVIINAVGSILIGFGILNNPTNKSYF